MERECVMNLFQKKDRLLIISITVIAAVFALVLQLSQRNMGDRIRITIDGSVYGEYLLSEDQVIDIQELSGHNQVVISGGRAYMAEADCPDKYCMAYKPISKCHETIVCLPHKLVVEVVGQSETADLEIDAVSQ